MLEISDNMVQAPDVCLLTPNVQQQMTDGELPKLKAQKFTPYDKYNVNGRRIAGK